MSNENDVKSIAASLEKIASAMPWVLVWLFFIALGTCTSSDSVDDLRADLKRIAPISEQGKQ